MLKLGAGATWRCCGVHPTEAKPAAEIVEPTPLAPPIVPNPAAAEMRAAARPVAFRLADGCSVASRTAQQISPNCSDRDRRRARPAVDEDRPSA